MEILSTRPQNLSLEARHTISLEVARQRRLKVATSLFLPRKSSKLTPPSTKEKSTMTSKPSYPAEESDSYSDNPSSSNTVLESGMGVITYGHDPNSASCSSAAQLAEAYENTIKKRGPAKKLPKTPKEPKAHTGRSRKKIGGKPLLDTIYEVPPSTSGRPAAAQQKVVQSPYDLSFNNIQFAPKVIEISSDEDENNTFMSRHQFNPLRRLPEQNTPQQSTHLRHMHSIYPGNNYQQQYQQYASALPAYTRPGYTHQAQYAPGLYQSPGNYQSGFYTESHPNTYRMPPIAVPNHAVPDMRFRPYQGFQKLQNPYHSQVQSLPQLLPSSNQSMSTYPPYQKPLNQTTLGYGPTPSQPAQQRTLLTLSAGHHLRAFCERMHDLCQSGFNPESSLIQPKDWSEDNMAAAVDFAVSMMREGAMMRQRMENNTAQLNSIIQQPSRGLQPPSSPSAYPDSTTSLPSNREMFASNMPQPHPRFQPNNQHYYNQNAKPFNSGNSASMSPAMSNLSLNDPLPVRFYVDLINSPEYDPRDNR